MANHVEHFLAEHATTCLVLRDDLLPSREHYVFAGSMRHDSTMIPSVDLRYRSNGRFLNYSRSVSVPDGGLQRRLAPLLRSAGGS